MSTVRVTVVYHPNRFGAKGVEQITVTVARCPALDHLLDEFHASVSGNTARISLRGELRDTYRRIIRRLEVMKDTLGPSV